MSDLDYFLEKKELLEERLKADPDNWDCRKELAHLLYNQGYTKEAAELVWSAPQVPSVDLEIAFAAKVVGKARPGRAIRLLNEVMEMNQGKAVQNLGLANALLHHGMVMQAARFYGAALEADPGLASADLEHFLLWIDDTRKLWGDFKDEFPKLEELPWMTRDIDEAERLKQSMTGHTTPISIPGLKKAAAEEALHAQYVQADTLRTKATPPPAVTIPMDRVNPKDVLIDNERGAGPPPPPAVPLVSGSNGLPVSPVTATPLPEVPKPVPIMPPSGQTVRSMALQNGSGPQPPVTEADQSGNSGPTPTRPISTRPLAQVPAAPQVPAGGGNDDTALADGKVRIRRSS